MAKTPRAGCFLSRLHLPCHSLQSLGAHHMLRSSTQWARDEQQNGKGKTWSILENPVHMFHNFQVKNLSPGMAKIQNWTTAWSSGGTPMERKVGRIIINDMGASLHCCLRYSKRAWMGWKPSLCKLKIIVMHAPNVRHDYISVVSRRQHNSV